MNVLAAAPKGEARLEPRSRPLSVGVAAVHGAFWNVLFSALNKVVAFGSQIALAWFLVPEDMGLAGIALSIISVVSIISGTNLAILLVQSRDNFEENTSEVFWLSLTLNAGATLLLIAFAPLAGHLFNEPRLIPIILILAPAVPLMALPTIYSSYLYRELRFRALAQIQFGEGLIRNLGSVLLAALGFGAYSLVLPQPVGSLFGAVSYRVLTGEIPIGRPHPRRWPALLSPIVWLMLLALLTALQTSGIIFLIGVMRNPIVTGFYAWGFALSSQAIFLLGHNLQGVFFPVLSKLNHDSLLQSRAFCKACKVLVLVIAPVCALQIVLAHPVIELLFRERWLPAVPVVQWLSLGMITQPLSILGSSLLLARGQYRRLALLTGCLMLLITTAAFVGAWWGLEERIAECTGITLFFTNLVGGWVAYRQFKGDWSTFPRELLSPIMVAFPLIGVGAFFAFVTRDCPPLVSVVTTAVLLAICYLFGICLLAPRLAKEVISILTQRIGHDH